jgi:hypothetical protein
MEPDFLNLLIQICYFLNILLLKFFLFGKKILSFVKKFETNFIPSQNVWAIAHARVAFIVHVDFGVNVIIFEFFVFHINVRLHVGFEELLEGLSGKIRSCLLRLLTACNSLLLLVVDVLAFHS